MVLTALALALAGCGLGKGGEDFALTVDSSPDKVMALLGGISPEEAGAALTGVHFTVTSSTPGEVVYSIPMVEQGGKRADPALIRLVLEPAKDGKTTVIHADVDVPAIQVMLGKAKMYLSESKVENELRKALKTSFQSGSTPSGSAMAELLAGVAIAGNSELQAQINSGSLGETTLGELFGEGEVEIPEGLGEGGAPDIPAPDPAAGVEAGNQPEDPYADAQSEGGFESSGEEF
jgi:hypothetical protein